MWQNLQLKIAILSLDELFVFQSLAAAGLSCFLSNPVCTSQTLVRTFGLKKAFKSERRGDLCHAQTCSFGSLLFPAPHLDSVLPRSRSGWLFDSAGRTVTTTRSTFTCSLRPPSFGNAWETQLAPLIASRSRARTPGSRSSLIAPSKSPYSQRQTDDDDRFSVPGAPSDHDRGRSEAVTARLDLRD